MFHFFMKSEDSLTVAGVFVCVVAVVICLALMARVAGRSERRQSVPTKQLVYGGAALALAFLTSYIKLIELPWGGSVTLCSMFFIALIGYWYGMKAGLCAGFAFGILQFLQGPYVLNFVQVVFDYFLPYTALGLAGLFSERKRGLQTGYAVGVLARGLFHAIAGYAFWMSYMPDNFPRSVGFLYPIVYNYSYLITEAAMTLVLISIPSVAKGLARIKAQALTGV